MQPAPSGSFRVSVVIPAYNSATYVREAVDSVLRQTFPAHEILIVDDGSTDGTAAVVRSLKGPVRYFFQPNAGQAAARNRALREATGDWIALLDADDLWPPAKLEEQATFLSLHPHVDFVFGNLSNFRDTPRSTEPEILDPEVHADLRAHATDVRDLALHLLTVNPVAVSSVVFRRSCVEGVGHFDESLRYCEDLDYWLRIAARYRIGYLDRTHVLRRVHGKNLFLDHANRYRHRLRVLENLPRTCPDLPERVRRKLPHGIARANFMLGAHYRTRGDRENARRAFRDVRPLDLLPDWRMLGRFLIKRSLPRPLRSKRQEPPPSPTPPPFRYPWRHGAQRSPRSARAAAPGRRPCTG